MNNNQLTRHKNTCIIIRSTTIRHKIRHDPPQKTGLKITYYTTFDLNYVFFDFTKKCREPP